MLNISNCDFTCSCKKYKDKNCPLNNKELPNFCLRLFKIDQLQDLALLSNKQKLHVSLYLDADKSDLEAFNALKDIEKNIGRWVEEGNNLFLYSNTTGNGKSTWSIRLLNSYIKNIWYKSDLKCRGLFINIPRFLLTLKDNITQKSDYISYIKDNVLKADIVIWDDIATKGFTEFEMENILNIINNRIDCGKSNIYTSNLSGENLKEAIGDRLYSRIFNGSTQIQLVGTDKRGLNK